MGNYWTATDDILGSKGAPLCPHCGEPMAPADDHGRFICFCQGIGAGLRSVFDAVSGTTLPPPREIPQVDTTGMTDAQKSGIPPMHRLHSAPTAAEEAYFSALAQNVGSPEYGAALRKVHKEHRSHV